MRVRTVIVSATAASAAVLLTAGRGDALTLTRGPYLGRPGDASVAVVWVTDEAADSRVEYQVDGGRWETARAAALVTRHVVTLDALEPGAVYRYQVFSADRPLSDTATFRAPADASQTAVRFAVIGDTATGNPAARAVPAAIARQLAAIDPDLVLHTGDVVYPAGADRDYDAQFFGPLAPWLPLGPILPALGNHDAQTDRGAPYLRNFVLPENGVTKEPRFYALRQANALFVALDVETSEFGVGSRQYAWLAHTLRNSKATWKFVYFHEPPYSSHHPNNLVRIFLCPLFERLGVDIVFTGHVHLYERTWPIHDYVSGGPGVVYITEGGGGSPLSDYKPQPTTAFIAADYGFVEVQIDGGRLLLLAHHSDGAILDSLALAKAAAGSVRPVRAVLTAGPH